MGIINSRSVTAYHRLMYPRWTVIVVGLDGAGKTTIVNGIKKNEERYRGPDPNNPDAPYELETKVYEKVIMDFREFRGSEDQRKYWLEYCEEGMGVLFVVDSVARDRLVETREALYELMTKEKMRYSPLLLFINKQETKGAVDLLTLIRELKLDELCKDYRDLPDVNYMFINIEALRQRGLIEGVDWLHQQYRNRSRRR